MVDYIAWLQGQSSNRIDAVVRAIAAWDRINANPTTVTLVRNGVEQDAQRVRLVYETRVSNADTTLPTTGAMTTLKLFGVCNHPGAYIEDTHVQRGDVFLHDGNRWVVESTNTYPGEIHATCKANQ